MTIVIGVDPGATTGLVVVEVDPAKKPVVHVALQLPAPEMMLWIRREMAEDPPDLLAVERYTITARTAKLTRQTDALEIIGVVKAARLYLLTDQGIEVPLMMATPADAKTVWSDERLRRHDLYKAAPGHSRDALRHALLATERALYRIP